MSRPNPPKTKTFNAKLAKLVIDGVEYEDWESVSYHPVRDLDYVMADDYGCEVPDEGEWDLL